ncbi:Phospholipid/glycerol acyltransferase [Dillenia turbinata]|uniref:Phospholipid/glycerol acyltransferase n=1 Tax=Dillenia turbinata TaxID=194707 RepID=A0AAN8WIU9_9MAGN
MQISPTRSPSSLIPDSKPDVQRTLTTVRMRRLGSLFGSSMKEKEGKDEEGEEKEKEVNEAFEDDGGWFSTSISLDQTGEHVGTTQWLVDGTVGIAKKEIIFYPIYGQIHTLAHHLRIDRSNTTAAIESLQKAAQAIVKNNLSLVLFPEGTRSRNGRLLPFKKGFVHMAIQTGLPIVPILLIGTHLAWRKGSLRLRPTPITIKYLPPIKTDGWTVDNIDEYINLVHDVYVKNLPESQRPLELEGDQSH